VTEEGGVSLRQLLPERLGNLEDAVKEQLEKESSSSGARLAWNFLGLKGAEVLGQALDIDVFDVLARGWCKARELEKYTDRAKYPPDKDYVVFLGEHDLPPLSLHPELQFMIGRLPGPRLRFTLELSAHLRSIALSIRGGHITGIGAGEAFVSAQLKYGDVRLHEPLKSRHVTVGGQGFNFKPPGLAISRRAMAPSTQEDAGTTS
jgi:hypothetical protein